MSKKSSPRQPSQRRPHPLSTLSPAQRQLHHQDARLQKILQRLKSLILRDFDPEQRALIKADLAHLHQQFQTQELSFDHYKIAALSLLLIHRSPVWTEQFLYRETGAFLTQAEKFTLSNLQNTL